jgi:uncharacterized protein YqeY
MSILARLDDDLKAAMKARDELRVLVIRTLKSDLRYKKIDLGCELTDDDISNVLSSAVKKRRDSVEEYRRGGRSDLADNEAAEIDIIKAYLPKQLSDEELMTLVDKAVAESNARTIKDMGAVMKILMPEIRGRADGKIVYAAVKAKLESS